MIEALRGSANLAVTGRPSKNRMHQYRQGNGPWKEIHKDSVPGCSQAWRFSQPALCTEPEIDYTQIHQPKPDEYLISFYDALAMIQSECFMRRFIMSKEVFVSDDELKHLEWLHEDIRNEYEHFIPKSYSAETQLIIQLTTLSLRLSREVLFDSKNVFPHDDHKNIGYD